MLTRVQRDVARSMLICRPGVLPGTRVILDDTSRKQWFDKVCDAMTREGIKAPQDVQDFCDVAGVPD